MAKEIAIAGRTGTTTIVTDSFAVFGEISVGPPVPVDDPAKWHGKELDQAAVCRRYGTTVEELSAWQERYSFPLPCRKTQSLGWGLQRTVVKCYWHEEQLTAWDRDIRALAARGK